MTRSLQSDRTPGAAPDFGASPVGAAPLALGALVAILTATLAACGAGERAAAPPVVRDSAGITIVENSAPAWREGEAWRIEAAPDVDIGVFEGDEVYQLYQVTDAIRLADGTIVVANAGTQELRYYDADGRHLASAGGEGGGPGEFARLSAVYRLPGDTVLAVDSRQQRLSRFDATGSFLTSNPFPVPFGRFADGTLVRSERVASETSVPEGQIRRSFYLVRAAPGSDVLDTLALLPGTERYIRIQQSGGSIRSIFINVPPFGRTQQVAVADDRVYTGAGDRYEIEVYRPEGRLVRLIRRATPNRPVDADIIERFKAERLAAAESDAARRRVEQLLAEVSFPENMPAYGEFRVDAPGDLWVEEYRAPGEEQPRWSIFDPDGRWLGTVETPPDFEVFEIGADYLLGRWEDELEVEHVRLYGLVKPGKEAG